MAFVMKKLQISMAQNPIALVSTQDIYSMGFRVRVFWVEGLGVEGLWYMI